MNTKIEKLSSKSDLLPVARLYAQVFAGWPWYEVSRGPGCYQFRSESPGSYCPCGCGILEPAYPENSTANYISYELARPMAVGLLALAKSTPIGFAWGFRLSNKEFADTKYSGGQAQSIVRVAVPNGTYFYISEVGIDPQYQRQGLGTKLASQLAKNNRRKPLLTRTNQDSPMLNIARSQLKMTAVIAPWLDIADPENPARIVLIRT